MLSRRGPILEMAMSVCVVCKCSGAVCANSVACARPRHASPARCPRTPNYAYAQASAHAPKMPARLSARAALAARHAAQTTRRHGVK